MIKNKKRKIRKSNFIPVYSGDKSIEFWKAINSIKNIKIWHFVYGLGCDLQDLESYVLERIGRS